MQLLAGIETGGTKILARLDKGHTEGLEPKVTEEIVKLIVSAPGGRAQKG